MGSANPPKKRDYSQDPHRPNQSYQVAYWKERFGVSEQELAKRCWPRGPCKKVEEYLRSKEAR